MKYYISDLHLFHENSIIFDNRPFNNSEDCANKIIENWNSIITKDDDIYILGDFTWDNDKGLEVIKKLKGRKYLIKGNHDKVSPQLYQEFMWVKDYAEIKDENRLLILFHYPIAHWKNADYGSYHLYGHIHMGRDYEPFNKYIKEMKKRDIPYNCFNVGCMLPYMDYTPRTLDYLIQKGINKND